jgi:hypothetical protein
MRPTVLCLVASFILFAAGLAGTYKGTYSGSAGASGDFVVSLTQTEGGDWKSEVTFTLGGQDVKTKITSLKVDGAKLTIRIRIRSARNCAGIDHYRGVKRRNAGWRLSYKGRRGRLGRRRRNLESNCWAVATPAFRKDRSVPWALASFCGFATGCRSHLRLGPRKALPWG